MKSAKILTIVGARPQFVKVAALSPELLKTGRISEVLVHTGQHFDAGMSDVFFREMGIPAPNVNLGIGGGSHGENTGRMLEALERVIRSEAPEAVVVFGDTDSTLAGALAAAKLGVMLAHVEAGLRSFRRAMPEEINRVVTDHVSDALYAPSTAAIDNLAREGIAQDKVVRSGDVMCDVVRRFVKQSESRDSILDRLNIERNGFHLLTLHRKENTDDRAALQGILSGLGSSGIPVIFPVHPRTRKMLTQFAIELPPTIRALEPLGYLDTLGLISNARLVLTDSGGVQKEAYFVGRPCVTLRDETEWTELVDAGANVLVGANTARIAELVCGDAPWSITSSDIYGNGRAAELIANDLVRRVGG